MNVVIYRFVVTPICKRCKSHFFLLFLHSKPDYYANKLLIKRLMIEKLVSILAVDAELAGSSIAGTVTESLVHPRDKKYFLRHFLRAMTVGWLLATFVSPAVAERMNLSKEESVAVAFIGGYAGIKLLNAAEVVAINKIISKKEEKED